MHLGFHFLVAILAGWINRHQAAVIVYLQTENRALREQLGDRRVRWTDAQRRRLAEKARAVGRAALGQLNTVVTPDVVELIRQMARENPSWGYTRLRGALFNVGHEVARNTVKNVLTASGLEPAPERGSRTSWSTFLKAHWGAVSAADVFTVEVVTAVGIVRYFVFFVLDLRTRRVHVAGITHQPGAAWMKQIARNLTDAQDGFPRGYRFLILDRDPLFAASFRSILASAGVKALRLPARSPNLNAFAERLCRTHCAVAQVGVPRPHHSSRRATPAPGDSTVRRALPRGAKPSGAREHAH
jgi:hypothetical protein